MIKEGVYALAADFHETYERIAADKKWAVIFGVAFADLPEDNKVTMLKVCQEIYDRHIKPLEDGLGWEDVE